MKYPIIAIVAGVAVALFQNVASAALDAESAHAALKEHGCLTCHAIDKKKVGPAYKDVAVQFKGKTATDLMAAMKSKPPHAGVLKKISDNDLKEIMEWILTLSK
jgi:cytochrome c